MKGQPLSAYRSLWLITMFDLPVEMPTNKCDYTRFRKASAQRWFHDVAVLDLREVYFQRGSGRFSPRTIRAIIPPLGQVRLMTVTDHQFEQRTAVGSRLSRASVKQSVNLMLQDIFIEDVVEIVAVEYLEVHRNYSIQQINHDVLNLKQLRSFDLN